MTADSTPTPRANLMDIGKPEGACGCGGQAEGDQANHSRAHFQAKLDALRTPAPAAEEN